MEKKIRKTFSSDKGGEAGEEGTGAVASAHPTLAKYSALRSYHRSSFRIAHNENHVVGLIQKLHNNALFQIDYERTEHCNRFIEPSLSRHTMQRSVAYVG